MYRHRQGHRLRQHIALITAGESRIAKIVAVWEKASALPWAPLSS
jgi:hypothetical protein